MQAVHYPAATTTVNGTPQMTALATLTSNHFSPRATTQPDFEIPRSPASSDKFSLADTTYTTQYYTTIHPDRLNAMHADSPTAAVGDQEDASSSKSNSSSSDSESSGGEGEGEREAGECMASLRGEPAVVGGTIVSGDGAIKNWTYEDQFKQLYNMTPEQERREFLDKLFSYMQNKGTPITRIPIMAKQPLDLYKLFKLVVQRGGLVEVIKKKAWRNVAKELNLPASITSAAFTMRSQYVKYLYPYECEVSKLSSPHELQQAIESNKRDRRHSDTVDFLSPQMTRSDLEQAISPVTSRQSGGSTQGLQLITSPTVAIPHGAMSPYSGGFIVAGNGGHQVVQMAHHIPGIPIVVPGSTTTTGHAQSSGIVWAGKVPTTEEPEDNRGELLPPVKKMALDMSSSMVTRLPHGMGNFIVAPGGSVIQQHPSSPQFIQMAPGHPQIPIVIPAPVPARANGKDVFVHKHGSSPKGIETHSNEMGDSLLSRSMYHPSLVRVTQSNALHQHQHQQQQQHVVTPHIDARPPSESETGQRLIEVVGERSPSTATKMPFANISIQSADGKTDSVGEGRGESLLVTMEINNVVFQGVLFAKPQRTTGSPNSK